jgi:hypothetical protein
LRGLRSSASGTAYDDSTNFADKPGEKQLSYKELLQKLHSPGNGLRDFYKVEISVLNLPK